MEFIDLKSQYLASRALINARIQAVLDHGQYIMGPEVAELEARLAAFTGARHCITVSSCTDALVIALMALGVKAGDEVITTPFSFIATAEAVLLVGATPVFVDVEAATGNLDAGLVAERITARTRAIIPVSLYGQAADMDAINAIAEPYGIPVIEDGAQSFGATYRGRASGKLSTIGCTSFFPSKPLGCYGDGGALFTDDDGLAQAMREIRIHGQSHRYVHTRLGVGGRMDTLQCAVVLAKLERFEWEITQRQRVAADYNDLLRHQVPALAVRPERSSVYAQYTVLVDERERVRKALDGAGIPTAVHYPVPIHRQGAYAHLAAGVSYPVAEALARRVLSLPMGPYLERADVQRVAQALLSAVHPTNAGFVHETQHLAQTSLQAETPLSGEAHLTAETQRMGQARLPAEAQPLDDAALTADAGSTARAGSPAAHAAQAQPAPIAVNAAPHTPANSA